jgi:hypothetical protein
MSRTTDEKPRLVTGAVYTEILHYCCGGAGVVCGGAGGCAGIG